jgi:tellurite resistance protein TerC
VGTPLLWTAFLIGVVVVVAIDLLASRGKPVTARKAAIWTGVWISLSLAFGGVLWHLGGPDPAIAYLTAYVVEYALSVDNLFVFLVVFSYFKVSSAAQFRLLYWGIIGAFILRGVLIVLGTSLVSRFEWLLYIFGAFLLFTAYKLLFAGEEEQIDPETTFIMRAARRVLPVASGDHGLAFFVRQSGRVRVTALFLVLIVVETTDLIFALDSIPAVLGISQDPFIVFSSNACAILGLRSLFFVVSSLMDKFRFLKLGLGAILAFVGLKLILETAFKEWAHHNHTLVMALSLGFIIVSLAISVVASVFLPATAKASVESKNHGA